MPEVPTNHIPEKSDKPSFVERFILSKWLWPILLSTAATSAYVIGTTIPQRVKEMVKEEVEKTTEHMEGKIRNEANLAVARAMADRLDIELPPGIDGDTAIKLSAEALAIRSIQQALAAPETNRSQTLQKPAEQPVLSPADDRSK